MCQPRYLLRYFVQMNTLSFPFCPNNAISQKHLYLIENVILRKKENLFVKCPRFLYFHFQFSFLDIGRSPAYYEVYPSKFKSATQKWEAVYFHGR